MAGIYLTKHSDLTAATIPTRTAARLAGVSRATATRTPVQTPTRRATVAPVNKLSPVERARILTLVTSPELVDLAPIQIYARLLDQGVYVGSISTIYRVLAANKLVKERRRLARHPARAIPELVATGPRPGLFLGHHQTRRAHQGPLLRLLRDDRYLLPLHRRRLRSRLRIR